MKKDEIPQDHTPLEKFTKEICYAVDESGNYTVGLSTGWQIKADALGITWEEAQQRVIEAKQKVERGEASPILFFMELNMMDVPTLAAYTGFWGWTVKRHLKAGVFKGLSDEKLSTYAEVFDVSVEGLKTMKPNEN